MKHLILVFLAVALFVPICLSESNSVIDLSKIYEVDGFTFSAPSSWHYSERDISGITYHYIIRSPVLDYWGGLIYYYTYGFGESSMVDILGHSAYDGFFSGLDATNIRREDIFIGSDPACIYSAYITFDDTNSYTVGGLVYMKDYICFCAFYIDRHKSADENMAMIRNLCQTLSYFKNTAVSSDISAQSEKPSRFYDVNTDLSDFSYEELLQLRADVDAALWASDSWQDVTVPTGVYIVGEDIPAGKWSIEIGEPESEYYTVCSVATYGTPDDYYNSHGCVSSAVLQPGIPFTLNIIDGQLVEINGNRILFHPFTGASIGFK